MEKWKNKYPYTLDKPLTDAIKMALNENDHEVVKKLWDIFTSYRKSSIDDLEKEWEDIATK